MSKDRSFCDIAQKFKKNIYGTSKGIIRERVLQRDLSEHVAWLGKCSDKKILDVGGGQAQLALFLAQKGHQVTVIDISSEMLNVAKSNVQKAGLSASFEFIHAPLQEIEKLNLGQFDLVLCHAVLEWVAEQKAALNTLSQCLNRDGLLSLMYFNHEAKRLANILYGNFDYVFNDLKVKQKVGLSPNFPIANSTMQAWLSELKLNTREKTGVRCFHDYMRNTDKASDCLEELIDIELKFNRLEPYASMGRYTHLIIEK